MFTSKELEGIPIPLSDQVAAAQDRIMDDLVARIKASGEISSTADWEIQRLRMMGMSKRAIRKTLKKLLGFTEKELNRLYGDVLERAYIRDKAAYVKSGTNYIAFKKNKELLDYIGEVKEHTAGEFTNITKTIGFVTKKNGKLQFTELSKFYQETLDGAVTDLLTGTADYNSILKRVVGEMTASELRTVDYASGRSMRIESAMRNALMTGFNNVVSKRNEQVAKDLKTEYFEVDWHGGARPSHQQWQGKVYSKQELVDICGLGKPDGILGCNCYHSYNAFIPGVSVRTYRDDWLDKKNEEENKPKPYGGKEYTTYQATQTQRKMEVLMRKQRANIKLLKAGGADDAVLTLAKAKYRGTNAQYAEFSKAMNIPQQKQRVTVDGLGRYGEKR